jgi:hypothetical protein
MFSKLLQLDTDSVTPERAATAFLAEVNRLVREQGLSLSTAWQQVKSLEPELCERFSQKAPAESAPLANTETGTAVPAGKAFYLPLMQLPADTTDQEFSVAWKANGCQASPLDAKNMFMALVVSAAKQNNVTVAIARRMIQDRFTTLAAVAGQKVAG